MKDVKHFVWVFPTSASFLESVEWLHCNGNVAAIGVQDTYSKMAAIIIIMAH
jgi:hypothetical protein